MALWSTIPTCLPSTCTSSCIPLYGSIVYNSISYGYQQSVTLPSGTSAPFTCNQGYSPSNTNTLIQCIQTVTNSPTGTITPLPTCIPNYCSTLLSPSTNGLLNNQQQTINGTTGKVVQFSCSQGYTYTSVNTSSTRCQIDGTWSNQEGICTPSPCQSIQLPLSDGLVVSSINGNTGDIITYTCASYGYTLTGSSQQICLPTGYLLILLRVVLIHHVYVNHVVLINPPLVVRVVFNRVLY